MLLAAVPDIDQELLQAIEGGGMRKVEQLLKFDSNRTILAAYSAAIGVPFTSLVDLAVKLRKAYPECAIQKPEGEAGPRVG